MENNKFGIRAANIKDAEKLIKYLELLAEEQDVDLPLTPGSITLSVEDEVNYLQNHIQSQNCAYYIAVQNGEIIGALNCTSDMNQMTKATTQHCVDLGVSVRKDKRGMGVGTALMKTALDWAFNNPEIKRIQLEVFATNQTAIHIYKKLGFQMEGTRYKAFFKNGQYIDSVQMAILKE